MDFFKSVGNRIGVVSELFRYLWRRKMWWMIPMILFLLFFGFIIALTGSSPVSPFIYAIF